MVQPAKKGRESSSELESKGSNKRQKSSDQAGQETRNAANTTKRQARVSGDQSASPSTSRKRSRGPLNDSDNTPDNSLAENTTTISEVDSANVPAIRDNAIEKRMELIKQLLEQKENELKEIAFLESGHNLLDYDPLGKGKLIPKEEPTDSVDAHKKGQRTPTSRTKRQSSDSLIQPSSAPQTPLQTTPLPTTPQATPDAAAPQTPIQQPLSFPSIFTTPPPISDKVREQATHDASIIKRVGELQRTGMWSLKRMPKAPEPPRVKVHWDHVLAEMAWLANDFKQERKWKMALAKKVSKQVMRYHQMQETREQRKLKEEEQHIRKVASGIAREVKKFWQKIEKVVQFKQQTKIDEKKKEVMDKHLDFLVGQTEKYFEMIASDLKQPDGESQPQENIAGEGETKQTEESKMVRSHTQDLLMESEEAPEEEAVEEDAEFELPEGAAEEVDDEETLEEEETKEESDLPKGEEELSQLQRESEMPLEDLIKNMKEHAGEEGDEEEADDDEDDEDDNDGKTGKERISEAAAAANAAQPTGFTLSTTKVKTKVPFLLHGTLREYQHIGLDWIVTMYEKRLNGILADEMGLGKTIMTISMLAHLACEKGIWGPHLIVVPTSVMLNWELEFKKWCPAFKILTYFGSQKERKMKRQGWSKTNSFHVCITSYKVVVQDQQAFRRKKWKYFILDEAHNIKNFRSQRWQVLLNFNSKRRLLLTGTPLQNSLMELWSLMHFLMPHMFQSHKEFKDWFSNPVTGMIEGTETLNEDLITRLHAVLRPFLLRRLKKDVEKQLPNKYHHLVNCQLSKRQRFLYEEFISSAATQDTLKSGNFLGIINVLMQLRKVCNHPDLFEGRPIISPFDMESMEFYTSSAVCRALEQDPFESVNLPFLNLSLASTELEVGHLQALSTSQLRTPPKIIELSASPPSTIPTPTPSFPPSISGPSVLDELCAAREERIYQTRLNNLKQISYINEFRCSRKPLYGCELIRSVKIHQPVQEVHSYAQDPSHYLDYPNALTELVRLPTSRAAELNPTTITQFVCIIPKARAPPPVLACPHPHPSTLLAQQRAAVDTPHALSPLVDIFRPAFVRAQVYFPDKRLVQYDCGKLQQLDTLLRTLKSGSHRALIFTQMTRMLDVLEAFLNVHGYTYLRLDGATKVEKRQQLTERFNADPKIFVFILSTRSGGVGINLTGADSVIFYDSDWNPAMDAQAQDRCHRIGQTRDVHIYRLITEYTIEENILKKANQKRHLDDMVIQGGGFTTDFFKNVDIRDLFESSKFQIDSDSAPMQLKDSKNISQRDWESAVANAEDETDATALRQAQAEQEFDVEEFNEETAHHEGTPSGSATQTATGEDMSFLQDDYDEEQFQGNKLASSSSGFSFEDSLLPIQRYALHFFESENPSVSQESIDAMDEEVDARQQEWQLENAKRMKEEEEERMSEDDDLLFYEVSGNAAEFKAKLLAEMDVYCPPNPDHEHLYFPPFDGDDYLSLLPPIPPSFFEYEDELPHQNEQPDKKTLIPFTPPGEAGDIGEADAEHDGTSVKRKRIRHRKETSASTEAPHSPPSPTPQPSKQARRGRPKDPPGGLFTQRRRTKQKGEPAPKVVKEVLKDKDPWSAEEDSALSEAIRTYGLNWDLACDVLTSNPALPSRRFMRTPATCAERYRSVILPKASGEASSTSPPPSPIPPSQSQSSQGSQAHFGIMDVIRTMVTQKKDIPGMIGSVAQTDQTAERPPHASHLQAAMHAGVTKAFTPREVVAMLAHKLNVVVPNKEVPPLSKTGLKVDPKVSGFGQGYSLGLMNMSVPSSNQGMAPGGVASQAMLAGQGVPAGSVPGNNAAGYSVPMGGAGVGMPASNSIIINPNGGNVQTSRKLAQINQSMHPGAVQPGAPRAVGGATVSANGAPGVVVAIPNATASVTVMPRGNGNNGASVNAPVAPTVNVNTAAPVLPSTTPAVQPAPTPAPAPAPAPATAKPSPSKRSKKNADGAGSTKRQRTKNASAAAAAAAAAATATATAAASAAATEQPQPTPSQPIQATPQPAAQSQPQPQPQQQPTTMQHPHIQPQQIQHPQILQQIQQQLLQHQQPHMGQAQPVNAGQMQPNQLSHQPQITPHIVTNVSQPQHIQPGMIHQHPQYQQGQPQQPQTIQTTQPYTNAQYTTQPTYATAGTYAAPTTFTTPAAGITYTTTYANQGYAAPPGSAPSTYTTPSPATNYATPTNFTNPNPSTYPATYSTGVAPTYAAAPSATPNAYTTASTAPTTTYVAPTSASNSLTSAMGSGYIGAPSTYIPNSVSAGAFTTPSTTSFSAPGYAPQGMVIGVPQQQQGTMIGGMPHNVIKGRAQQTAPPGTLRPAAMHTTSSPPGQTPPSVSSPSPSAPQ